jgi:ribosomal protein S8
MLIKKNTGGYINHLLTRLHRAIASRKSSIVVKKLGSASSKILNILVTEGFIKSYVEYPDLIVVNLKVSFLEHRFEGMTAIRPVSRYGRKTALPLQMLKTTFRRSGSTPCIILQTDKGLSTSVDAIRLNIGGKGVIQIS